MKKLSFAFFLGFMSFFVSFGMLSAENKSYRCESEADRYCSDIEPGQGRIWKCLKKNESRLGSQCRNYLKRKETTYGEAEDIEKACKSDRKKHCKYVSWGDGRVKKCLKIHENQLSSKCHKALRD